MIRGLYTSGTGMRTQMQRLDVISNNLANVDTMGYKKDDTITSSFPDMLMSRISDTKNNIKRPTPIGNVTLGSRVDQIYTDFSQGALVRTDENFNVAIQGKGFFVINTPEGEERYSRDGAFIIGVDGQLQTQDGNHLMGQNGILTLNEDFLARGNEVRIDDNGDLIINGQFVDTIRMVDFEDHSTLDKIDDSLYQGNGDQIPFEGKLVQGFLEGSNVNSVAAMVDMITVSRTYEANQKMIQVHDMLMGKAVNEIGKA